MGYDGGNSSTRDSFLTWCDSVFTENTLYDFNAIHHASISEQDRYMIYVAEMLNENGTLGHMACHIQGNSLYAIIGILLLALIFFLKKFL